MERATHASVTEVSCTCRYLEHQANDPSSPITFDPRLNEYHFEYPSPGVDDKCEPRKSNLIIYHCPFCGGAAPESKRKALFADIPPAEGRRLFELLGRIKTLDEAIGTLGPPDDDSPSAITSKQPEVEGVAPTIQSYRTLRYSRLSQTADVVITDWGSGEVHVWLQGKYLGLPE